MRMAEDFANIRLQNKHYVKKLSSTPLQRYLHVEGWSDTAVDSELIYSHRDTWYSRETFTEKFHVHQYYELIVYIKGNVEYINENSLISPSPYMVTWFRPGQLHTGRLLSPSQYERYVLYFSPNFFSIDNRKTPIFDFINNSAGTHMTLTKKKFNELLAILSKADELTETKEPFGELVLKSLLIEFFYVLNSQQTHIHEGDELVESMAEIKHYIDLEYAVITSVSEIADHFFYSREHLSRKFKQSFNMSIAQYLSRRRIQESLALLQHMSVTDAAYAVGFRSQSVFITAFKKNMGCLPSEYKAKLKL